MLNSKYSNHSLSFFPDLQPYVITMSFDSAEWRKDFIEKAELGSSYTEMSYYNPKAEYGTLTKTYFIYCQPIVFFLLTVWLTVLIRALWTSEYVKKFGFMTLYSCIDLLSLIVQDVFYAYVFTLKQNYLQYEMCYAFEFVTQLIPRNLYMISQWLKVGHAFQRFIILSKPINYRAIFNERSVVTFFIVIIVVSCSFSTVWFLLIDFERVVIIDKTKMETIAIGRKPGFFSKQDNTFLKDEHKEIRIASIVLDSVLPFILLSFLSIKSVFIIRKQIKFRKQFNLDRTAIVVTSERLVKVTMASTIMFATFTVPNLPIVIYLDISKYDPTIFQIIEYSGVVSSALFIMGIPVNFLIFSWLSVGFRKSVKKILKHLRRQSITAET